MLYERTKAGYAEYLKSEHWEKLKAAVLSRDRHRCRKCELAGWQVHHLIYRDDWEDGIAEDCITLCRECHLREHNITDPVEWEYARLEAKRRNPCRLPKRMHKPANCVTLPFEDPYRKTRHPYAQRGNSSN